MTPKHIPQDRVIPENDYNKLKFQLRTQIHAVMNNLRCYGLESYVDADEKEIERLCENFGQAVRGDNHKPIHVVKEPNKRATE